MARLLSLRSTKSRVEPNEYGHLIAIPCLWRATVELDNGETHFFSADTRAGALKRAERALPGLQFDWKTEG